MVFKNKLSTCSHYVIRRPRTLNPPKERTIKDLFTYSIRHSLEGSRLRLRHVFGDGEEVTLQQMQQSGGPSVDGVQAWPEGCVVEAGDVAQRYDQLLHTNKPQSGEEQD